MSNLIKIRGYYYYNRRIPEIFREYDPRNNIRITLKTKVKGEALRSTKELNHRIEAYWHSLAANNARYDPYSFKEAIKEARLFPRKREVFSINNERSITASELRDLLLHVLLGENLPAEKAKPKQTAKKIKSALELYFKLSKDKTLYKSENQILKWQRPRQRTVINFVKVCGNKPITEISRDDLVAFRDWWMKRIKKGLKPSTANKDFIHLKVILETVSDHLGYKIDTTQLFKRIRFKAVVEQARLPLPKSDIISVLQFLKGHSEPALYNLVAILAETGARPSEILGLLPEDIHLETDTPYISIVDRKKRELKTPYSQREIPIVGYALNAFKNQPNGFKKYRDRVDETTTKINKLLRTNNLFPSRKHSLYSLRHSFQDRVLSINMPDRIQADLMGHKFERIRYGTGASLEQKYEMLNQAKLKSDTSD